MLLTTKGYALSRVVLLLREDSCIIIFMWWNDATRLHAQEVENYAGQNIRMLDCKLINEKGLANQHARPHAKFKNAILYMLMKSQHRHCGRTRNDKEWHSVPWLFTKLDRPHLIYQCHWASICSRLFHRSISTFAVAAGSISDHTLAKQSHALPASPETAAEVLEMFVTCVLLYACQTKAMLFPRVLRLPPRCWTCSWAMFSFSACV